MKFLEMALSLPKPTVTLDAVVVAIVLVVYFENIPARSQQHSDTDPTSTLASVQ